MGNGKGLCAFMVRMVVVVVVIISMSLRE